MANKSTKTLPKTLPGVVRPQWIRCGKAGCRCARGRPHGPYFYRFWRQGGRLRKQYVRPDHVERVRAACQARRQERLGLAGAWRLWQALRDLVREVERR